MNRKQLYFFFLLFAIQSCQTDDYIHSETKDILHLYINTFSQQQNYYIYHESIAENKLHRHFSPPVTLENLAGIELLLEDVDSLFNDRQLQSLNEQLADYTSFEWPQELFPAKTKFIRENEIPEFLFSRQVPPPGEETIFIRYLSPPFFLDDEAALLIVQTWSSPAYVVNGYLYFIKENDRWIIKARNTLSLT